MTTHDFSDQVRATAFSRRLLLQRGTLLGIGIAAAGMLAACGGSDTTPAPTAGTTAPGTGDASPPAADASSPTSSPSTDGGAKPIGEVVFIEGTDLTTLDPQFITDTPSNAAAYILYDSLTWYHLLDDGQLENVPQLATKWEVDPNNLDWTFDLRESLTFSDGSPLTASDVVFTIKRIQDPANATPTRAIYEIITDVKAIDPTTVQITTSAPYPDMLVNAGRTPILSEKVVSQYEVNEYGRHPIGCGPFVLENWVPGDHASFVPNDDYWGEKAKVARIIYKPVPEAATRAAMMRTGEADIAVKIAPSDIPALENEPSVTVLKLASMYQISFELNCAQTDPPLNNQKVRQALNYAVDKEAICKDIMRGLAVPVESPFGPGIQYRATFPVYEYDPEKAKQLLAEAGYPNGFKMELWSPQGRYLEDSAMAQAVQGYIRAVGIDCSLRYWEWAPYTQAIVKDEARQAVMVGRATPGADYTATRLFSKAAWGQYNTTNFESAKIEELLPEARTEFDPEQRAELYQQILQEWWEQAPWVFLDNQRAIVAIQKDVQGFEMWPQEVMVLRNVSKA